MAKVMVALIGGVLVGIVIMLGASRYGASGDQRPGDVIRDIADVPKVTQAVAERHRDEQYANLSSVTEVVALPTAFARTEAMYALAGRSGSAGVQDLIFEADRVADVLQREDLLNVLFFRLAELDPQSALALTRIESFKATRSLERTVWQAWARNDLDDALFAAKTQPSLAEQKAAAQSLYAAFGYMGHQAAERIEEELGIGPDRSSRARYLYRLADASPAEAIAFINGTERSDHKREYVSWLAYYLASRDPAVAGGYEDLFTLPVDRRLYSSIVNRDVARQNPRATIDSILAGRRGPDSDMELHSAIQALVHTDLDAAKLYFEQARSVGRQRNFGSAIARELAKTDPTEAMIWARANDKGELPLLQMSALNVIAYSDPQLAFEEALGTPNAEMRSRLVSTVAENVARLDPVGAVAFLEQIEDGQLRTATGMEIASAWMRQDPDAAIDWILGQDRATADELIQMAGFRLTATNVDAAIRLLPRLGEANQVSLRLQIAEQLARQRSAAEAQHFAQQFEGQPGYTQLQATVIAGIARTDVTTARHLAGQLEEGRTRDTAYSYIINQLSRSTPAQAAEWLGAIGDGTMRAAATGRVARHWYAQNPTAATQWAGGLPAGPARDDAILQLSQQWRTLAPEQERLIASIGDAQKRVQAKVRQVHILSRTDPAKARRLLADEDIPLEQRQQLEKILNDRDARY